MKKNILMIGLVLFLGGPLGASYFAQGDFEGTVLNIKGYSINDKGEVKLKVEIRLDKIISTGGHNKDHGKQLLGTTSVVEANLDPGLKEVLEGAKVLVTWRYFNGLTPTGTTEGTIWGLAPLNSAVK